MVQKLQLKNTEKSKLFGACNFDLDLMALVLILNLNIILTYLHEMRSIGQMVPKLWIRNTEQVGVSDLNFDPVTLIANLAWIW